MIWLGYFADYALLHVKPEGQDYCAVIRDIDWALTHGIDFLCTYSTRLQH
jgi:hypothetical protein